MPAAAVSRTNRKPPFGQSARQRSGSARPTTLLIKSSTFRRPWLLPTNPTSGFQRSNNSQEPKCPSTHSGPSRDTCIRSCAWSLMRSPRQRPPLNPASIRKALSSNSTFGGLRDAAMGVRLLSLGRYERAPRAAAWPRSTRSASSREPNEGPEPSHQRPRQELHSEQASDAAGANPPDCAMPTV